MTIQEKIQENRKKAKQLDDELLKLKSERLNETEFEVGEMVDVYSLKSNRERYEHNGLGIIERIGVDNEGFFTFRLNKVKKDGTGSKHNHDTYCKYEVEKIKVNDTKN